MGLFQEYMDAKGTIKKPVVCIVGGKPSPETPPNNPPKEHGAKPYIAKSEKSKKAFGDMGDYEYKPGFEGQKQITPAKIPTAEQAEIVALVADAMAQDPTITENLVYQLRNKGLLANLVAEMLEYKETFKHITEVMSHSSYGPRVCSKLIRAMKEEVAPPFGASLEGKNIEDSPEEAEEGDDDEFVDDLDNMYSDDDDYQLDDDMGEMDDMNTDPNMMQGQDPLMSQNPQMQPQMSPAMMNLKRAMMHRR